MRTWTWATRLWVVLCLLGLAGDWYYYKVLNVHRNVMPPSWLTPAIMLVLAGIPTMPVLLLAEIVLLVVRMRRWREALLSAVLFLVVFVLTVSRIVSGMASAR